MDVLDSMGCQDVLDARDQKDIQEKVVTLESAHAVHVLSDCERADSDRMLSLRKGNMHDISQ